MTSLTQERNIIVRPARPEEYPAIGDLAEQAFGSPSRDTDGGTALERQIIEVISQEDPTFRPEHLRLVEANDRLISMMMLIERPLRFGSATVRGNVVAPVATHPDYEGQGYCSRVMRDALTYMKRAGFVVSLLWGVPWLYPHFGYSSALPWLRVSLKPQRIRPPVKRGDYHFEPLVSEHAEAVNALYAANQAHTTGSEVRGAQRGAQWWEWQPRHPQALYEVVLDGSDTVAGYFQAILSPARGLMVFDVGIRDPMVGEALLGRLVDVAEGHGLERFELDLSPDHPFARVCFAHNGEFRISRGGGAGMIRVLDPPALLSALEPLLQERIAHSEWQGADYVLRLVSDEGAATLHLARGKVHVRDQGDAADEEVHIPLAVLNPLVTGFQPRPELLAKPGVALGSRRAARLLEVLFPPGYPHWTVAAYYHE